jgi:ricin-type beta-trefoil lectin protein
MVITARSRASRRGRKHLFRVAAALLAAVVVVSGTPDAAQAGPDDRWEHRGSMAADGRWLTLIPLGSESYHLQNAQWVFAVDVPNSTSTWGTPLQLYPSNATNAQIWRFVHVGDGYYKLQPRSNPALCMDVPGGSTDSGTPVTIYGCDPNAVDQPNQVWRPVDVGDGWYKLVSTLRPDLVLTGVETDWYRGRLEIQPYTGSGWQKFRLYEETISRTNTVRFGANEWVKRHTDYCPHPYGVDEHGDEGNHGINDVHYHELSGANINERVLEAGQREIDIWYEKRHTGSQSGGIRFHCNLAGRMYQ